MSFQGVFERLLAGIPGARGAILVDWEGEAVAQAGRMDDFDLQVIGAHQGVILQHLRAAVARLGRERLRELVISSVGGQTLMLPVTDEYCLVLALDRSAPPGRARFEALGCLPLLRQEID